VSAPGDGIGAMSSSLPVPPGWPKAVRPPGAPDWERTAVAWLLDQCPPEYRGHGVITRHPVVLAWLTGRHADAGLGAARAGLAAVRVEVGDQLSPPALAELIEVLESEQVRLLAVRRAAGLLGEALRGHRYVPRL
jgi:hypothetical protein